MSVQFINEDCIKFMQSLKNESIDTILTDPPSYFLECLYTQDYDYVLDVFIEECKDNNVSILDAINYYVKNKKEEYECR